jgi:hypothetical protein
MPTPQRGDFVRVRTRRWLVEDERSAGGGLTALRLACVDDDAQGEMVEVLWDAELDGSVLQDEGWASISQHGTDDPKVFSAYLRTLRWNTATAADRDLFQAPFRAGIHQDAYQLLPLRKALRLPRVKSADRRRCRGRQDRRGRLGATRDAVAAARGFRARRGSRGHGPPVAGRA